MQLNHKAINKILITLTASLLLWACAEDLPESDSKTIEASVVDNPFMTELNGLVDYASVTAEDLTEYGEVVLGQAKAKLRDIKAVENPSFDSVVLPLDQLASDVGKVMNNSWMLYWVSPDEATRNAGIASYQKLNSWNLSMYADKDLFQQLKTMADSGQLGKTETKLVDDLLLSMRQNGVDLSPEDQKRFATLNEEITALTSEYSTNMNSHGMVLELDKKSVDGIPESLLSRYVTEEGGYKIPVISANYGPVVSNANLEDTRKAFTMMYAKRAEDKNLAILDQLVAKRHELAQLLGFDSYADYTLTERMAGSPDKVWDFLDSLTQATAAKATADLELIKSYRNRLTGTAMEESIKPWNFGYLHNNLLKSEFGVDTEEVRKYLPLDRTLTGMMEIYQQLLGLEFKPVDKPSVWHDSVEMYEVFEADKLVGRFYLDLFPRPNKESHFYGVTLTAGNQKPDGYEVPVAMLLGNFTPGTDDLPSLVTHGELRTLFHEFGHIANAMSYTGKYAMQYGSVRDFGEAMSQIFENWIWDYDILKTFAIHYDTGEVLPEQTFKSMVEAKTLVSGISAQRQLMSSMYDMELYNRYNPEQPVSTDQIWRDLGEKFVYSRYIEGTHPQAAWIHINTHPTYYYGYLWSRVYAQDMFTRFEENGLLNSEVGISYRRTILANGKQRPVLEAVKEFLGRAPNNDAYIRSLGLETKPE